MQGQSSRRSFLRNGLGASAAFFLPFSIPRAGQVMTVLGPVSSKILGPTLVHEHVLVDFIGANQVSPKRYDRTQAFETILPHLRALYATGCRTLVECTPAFLGRDPTLLKELSKASQLHILTNTGYYGAAEEKFLPASLVSESAESLSLRWISEFRKGIDDTGIRPGFMKLGLDGLPFTDNIQKILKAGALTHRATGIPVAVHTSRGIEAAREEWKLLRESGLPASSWIWVHAQNEKNPDAWEEMAKTGGWVELDGFDRSQTDAYRDHLTRMKKSGCIHRVLVSQDAGWYHVGETGGGNFRGYTDIFEHLLPALRKSGFTETDIRKLMVENPAEVFTMKVV